MEDTEQMLAAVHTTMLAGTNMLLDLLSSPPECNYWVTLREEVETIILKDEDWENYSRFLKLTRIDSAIRESLRINPVGTKGGVREVISASGLDIHGEHLLKGTWIGVPAVAVHHDERFYTNPQVYSPFRFVGKYDGRDTVKKGYPSLRQTQDSREVFQQHRKPPSLSTASDIYLAFGYGRHSW